MTIETSASALNLSDDDLRLVVVKMLKELEHSARLEEWAVTVDVLKNNDNLSGRPYTLTEFNLTYSTALKALTPHPTPTTKSQPHYPPPSSKPSR
jgi:hypothetical protein